MADKLKKLVSSGAGAAASGGLKDKFMKWLRFQGGAMDTYLLTGTEKKREEAGTGTMDQWAYRYPAPGSTQQGDIPYREPGTYFDIKYYNKDVRRAPSPLSSDAPDVAQLDAAARKLLEARASGLEVKSDAPKVGSLGNANPDVLRYNKDGLRTTMTATTGALAKSLAAYQQDHIPLPSWKADADEIVAEYESKGLPPVPGRGLRAKGSKYRHDPIW